MRAFYLDSWNLISDIMIFKILKEIVVAKQHFKRGSILLVALFTHIYISSLTAAATNDLLCFSKCLQSPAVAWLYCYDINSSNINTSGAGRNSHKSLMPIVFRYATIISANATNARTCAAAFVPSACVIDERVAQRHVGCRWGVGGGLPLTLRMLSDGGKLNMQKCYIHLCTSIYAWDLKICVCAVM